MRRVIIDSPDGSTINCSISDADTGEELGDVAQFSIVADADTNVISGWLTRYLDTVINGEPTTYREPVIVARLGPADSEALAKMNAAGRVAMRIAREEPE